MFGFRCGRCLFLLLFVYLFLHSDLTSSSDLFLSTFPSHTLYSTATIVMMSAGSKTNILTKNRNFKKSEDVNGF